MIRRRRKSRARAVPEVMLTPLIDTALTLLIIFMVTTPMLRTAIKIDLPRGASQEVTEGAHDACVYVDAQGKLYYQDKAITIAQLLEVLKKEKRPAVVVKADIQAPYGTVFQLMDELKVVGGIDYVALACQKNARTA